MRKILIAIICLLLLLGAVGVFVVHTKSKEPPYIEPTPNTVIISHKAEPKQEKSGVLGASEMTVAELEENTHAPLSQYAFYFIEAEAQTGVNAVFLTSVAALESGWGTSELAQNKNNLYGWTSNGGEMMTFDSKAQCIIYVAEKIKEHYLTPDGKYFNGYEVADINKRYNGRDEWAVAVTDIMEHIQKRV